MTLTLRGADKVLLVAFTMTAVSCTAPQYHEPIQGTQAKVRFVTINTEGVNVHVYKYEGDSCIDGVTRVGVLSGPALNHFRKRIGLPLGEKFKDHMLTEVTVEAGRPLTFAMAYWAIGGTCSVNLTFEPQGDKVYEFAYHFVGKKCTVDVFRIARSSTNRYERVPERTVRKSANQCTAGAYY